MTDAVIVRALEEALAMVTQETSSPVTVSGRGAVAHARACAFVSLVGEMRSASRERLLPQLLPWVGSMGRSLACEVLVDACALSSGEMTGGFAQALEDRTDAEVRGEVDEGDGPYAWPRPDEVDGILPRTWQARRYFAAAQAYGEGSPAMTHASNKGLERAKEACLHGQWLGPLGGLSEPLLARLNAISEPWPHEARTTLAAWLAPQHSEPYQPVARALKDLRAIEGASSAIVALAPWANLDSLEWMLAHKLPGVDSYRWATAVSRRFAELGRPQTAQALVGRVANEPSDAASMMRYIVSHFRDPAVRDAVASALIEATSEAATWPEVLAALDPEARRRVVHDVKDEPFDRRARVVAALPAHELGPALEDLLRRALPPAAQERRALFDIAARADLEGPLATRLCRECILTIALGRHLPDAFINEDGTDIVHLAPLLASVGGEALLVPAAELVASTSLPELGASALTHTVPTVSR